MQQIRINYAPAKNDPERERGRILNTDSHTPTQAAA